MSADAYYGIGRKVVVQPRVRRHVLVMRREIGRVVKLLVVLAAAARQLRQHGDVPYVSNGR